MLVWSVKCKQTIVQLNWYNVLEIKRKKTVTSSKRLLNMSFYVPDDEQSKCTNVQSVQKSIFFFHCLICTFLTLLLHRRRGCSKLCCISETLTWIKSILENSVTNSCVALIIVKWGLNCDILWLLKCYFKERVRSTILLTPCPRENLCSSAIRNVDVFAVGSKSWQGGRFLEKKINHILSKQWPAWKKISEAQFFV